MNVLLAVLIFYEYSAPYFDIQRVFCFICFYILPVLTTNWYFTPYLDI